MDKLIDITSYPVRAILKELLQDKTTKKNIIWATDNYADRGEGFHDTEQITVQNLLIHPDVIKTRIEKSGEEQQARTRKKAEVFTPVWLCNEMNNHLDKDWFGRTDVFNSEKDDHTWEVIEEKIAFPKKKSRSWKHYVDSRRLEITCGEAPFLVSRYDAATGRFMEATKARIGLLDRKLRIVNENTEDYDTWVTWTIRAFESVYGYEYQGDNVLLARANLLLTFVEYYEERWQTHPDARLLKIIANRIVWNIWQMDGLKNTAPRGKRGKEFYQDSLFEVRSDVETSEDEIDIVPCKIYDWRSKVTILFEKIKEM